MCVRIKCTENILSASFWFTCLNGETVTGVQRETDRRRGMGDDPADSLQMIRIRHRTSPPFDTGPHICAARAQ